MMTIKLLFETNDAAKCDDDPERMRRRRKCGRDRPPSLFDAFVKRERESV